MNDKKEKEKLYLNFLLKYLQYDYSEIKNPNDNPDFKLIINNKKIGIELTRIFDTTGKPTLMEIESEHEKIADKLLKLFNKAVLPKIDINISFVPSRPLLSKIDHQKYAWQLFDIILTHFPTNNSFLIVNDPHILPKIIVAIRVARYDFIEINSIATTKFGFVIKDFQTSLQKILDKKHKKINGYDKTCNEFWLLVYSDGSSGAAMFQPTIDTIEYKYTSKFKRVFYISNMNPNKIYELNLVQI